MAKKRATTKRIQNRRASFDYELGDSYQVGIALTGAETKSLRMGHGQLQGAYVTIRGDELWLTNAKITPSQGVQIAEDDQTRPRKLLAKRSEINKLMESRQEGYTIIPLEVLTSGRFIKLRIAVGRGKKRYDKRETIKRREQEREARRIAR